MGKEGTKPACWSTEFFSDCFWWPPVPILQCHGWSHSACLPCSCCCVRHLTTPGPHFSVLVIVCSKDNWAKAELSPASCCSRDLALDYGLSSSRVEPQTFWVVRHSSHKPVSHHFTLASGVPRWPCAVLLVLSPWYMSCSFVHSDHAAELIFFIRQWGFQSLCSCSFSSCNQFLSQRRHFSK